MLESGRDRPSLWKTSSQLPVWGIHGSRWRRKQRRLSLHHWGRTESLTCALSKGRCSTYLQLNPPGIYWDVLEVKDEADSNLAGLRAASMTQVSYSLQNLQECCPGKMEICGFFYFRMSRRFQGNGYSKKKKKELETVKSKNCPGMWREESIRLNDSEMGAAALRQVYSRSDWPSRRWCGKTVHRFISRSHKPLFHRKPVLPKHSQVWELALRDHELGHV